VGSITEDFRSQYLLHGEAIAIGMICESYLSMKLCGMTKDALDRISRYIVSVYGHNPVNESRFEVLIDFMKQDKKNEKSEINFSLLEREGKCLFNKSATPDQILESIQYYNQL